MKKLQCRAFADRRGAARRLQPIFDLGASLGRDGGGGGGVARGRERREAKGGCRLERHGGPRGAGGWKPANQWQRQRRRDREAGGT